MVLRVKQGMKIVVTPSVLVFGAAAKAISLPVPLVGQQGSFWCWAACLEMVDRWRRTGTSVMTQCSLASTHVTPNCCGQWPPSVQCDQGLSATGITNAWHQLGYTAAKQGGMIALSMLDAELGAHRPVQVGLTTRYGGHVVLVVGTSANGTQYTVHDPLPVQFGSITLASSAQMQAGLGQGNWTHTWYSI